MNQTHEPTLYDVMDAMKIFGNNLESLHTRVTKGFETFNYRMDTMDERLVTVERGVSNLTVKFADMQEDMTSILLGMDTHTEKIVRHERRIGALEKAV